MLKYIYSIVIFISCIIPVYAQTAKPALPYRNYYNKRGGTPYFLSAVAKKHATVAFLGGSITFNPGWREMLTNYLKGTYPKTKFRFIAAGIPSLGSLPHAFRLQRDVLDSGKVDLLKEFTK